MAVSEFAPRPRPVVNALNRGFWDGCANGELRIQRCGACRTWQHPPRARCAQCLSADIGFEAVSGRGAIYTFTVARHAARPGIPVPFVLALVELVEQPGLRLTTNIVGCDVDHVEIDVPVRLRFDTEPDGFAVPVFEPDLP